ncbi:hypothetical protein ABMA57_07400 [Saccharospirillum sp. HFRX-1]|uniref:Kelch repeat-containing protein n=1 Tax=unclassified Saccharospirillum TaxID=2633430 RepID=UPI00371D193F
MDNPSITPRQPWRITHAALWLTLGLVLAACDSGSSRVSPQKTLGDMELSAWVGSKGSQLTISGDFEDIDDLTFYLGQDPDCNVIADGETCAQEHKLTKQPYRFESGDQYLNLTQPSYARLRLGKQEATTLLNTQQFPKKSEHQAVYFKGRFWLVGGGPDLANEGQDDDLWSSADGINWRQETSVYSINSQVKNLFTGRFGHQLVVFKAADDDSDAGEQLWLIGGYQGGIQNDIWSSLDGINWTRRKDSTPEGDNQQFSPRYHHQVAVFDSDGNGESELWLLGGDDTDDTKAPLGDVWTSTDGIDWQQVDLKNSAGENEPLFSAREGHQLVAFDGGEGNQLWLIGGNNGGFNLNLNDIWSSPDGQTWTKKSDNNEDIDKRFSPRRGHQVMAFQADGDAKLRLWLVGGTGNHVNWLNDVWSSDDGINWTAHTKTPFASRADHQLIVADADHNGQDELLILAGYTGNHELNDIWTTSDGNTWNQLTPYPEFSARDGAQVVRFDAGQGERLWLVGGFGRGASNEVWSSADGIHWEQVKTAQDKPLFVPRSAHQLVVFDAKGDEEGPLLWLIGGRDRSSTSLNDVWSSPDGISWTQQDLSCEPTDCFAGRYGHQVVVFEAKGDDENTNQGEQLWLIGGYTKHPTNSVNDVWTSTNGKDWKRVKAEDHTAFEARYGHQVVVFDADPDNRTTPAEMWLIGGHGGDYHNDVWASKDGINWDKKTLSCQPVSVSCFTERQFHQLAVYAAPGDTHERLWLVGGDKENDRLNDVWSSSDGENWQLETETAAFSPRTSHQLVVFDNPAQPDNKALWVISGRTDQGPSNEIWRSTDGKDWRLSIKTPLQIPRPQKLADR